MSGTQTTTAVDACSASATDATLSREELVQRASDLVPVLKERAARAENLRQLPPETVQDLVDSRLMRVANPARYGGIGSECDAMFDVGWELGRGCGSTAWCYSIWAVHTWLVGHWPEPAQEEFFATGPDTLASSGLNPRGKQAEPVDGGFRVSGHWEFSSGCDAAGWAMLGAMSPGGPLWVLVPRADYEIVDNWYVSGLCGTGSKAIVIADAFVPAHRALDPSRAGDSDWTGWELHQRLSYRMPLRTLLGWDLVAPLVGIAQGTIDEFTSRTMGRTSVGGSRVAEAVPIQLRLAEASAEVDTARVLFRYNIDHMLCKAARGERFSALERARYNRDRAFVMQLCMQAVNRLFAASGGHALFLSEPLQRFHRDAHALSHRDGLTLDTTGPIYSRLVLGLE